ncbi:MAG: LUD domain-containing protein [Verrucomicrobiae bacterium]|nr:LUD domain-containing protein [Verrucomicrobiae bacterium]
MHTEDRQKILGAVRSALAPLKNRAAYPEYDPVFALSKSYQPGAERWEAFGTEFRKVHGIPLDHPSALAEELIGQKALFGYCDPQIAEIIRKVLPGDISFETEFDRAKVDVYQFGITRAAGAIAETGSVILNERTSASRFGALAPWVHVACVSSRDLLGTVAEGLEKLGDDPNIIWVTGPSKTADIEGVLVEGVHGPGIQICLLMD